MSEMYDNSQRTSFFKKDNSLENALNSLNQLIDNIQPPGESQIPNLPIVLIMGCPRAGSTLFLQWLAASGVFSYPSNLIARFYKNPYIGILAQQSLLEMDPLNQLGFKETEIGFSSSLGKTIGALSPSEFWYYWRQFFQFEDINVLSKEELDKVDKKTFLRKLVAFESLTGKAPAMKGMLLNFHIPFLYETYKKFIFIDVKREPFYNAQSLLFAREKFFNSREKWYSFKPEEYQELRGKSPIEQVAGQTLYIRKAIENGFKEVPDSNKLSVEYADFCSNPKEIMIKIKEKYNALGFDIDIDRVSNNIYQPFKANNTCRLTAIETKELESYIEQYSN